MGSEGSKEQIKKINNNQWINIGMQNTMQIVKSNLGNGEGQIRVISLDPKNTTDKQSKIYTYRKNTDNPLVKCLGVQFNKSESKTMCGNQQNARVLTQRIPLKLNDISSLSFPQSMYVLSQSLRGFQDLYKKAGVFQITDKMIGFNNDNQTKVWLNQNFAVNHPNNERPFLQTTTTSNEQIFRGNLSQSKMIKTITDLIEYKTQQRRFPFDLKSKLSKSDINFEQAWGIIQNYIKTNGFLVPNKLQTNFQAGSFTQSEINKEFSARTENLAPMAQTAVLPNIQVTNTNRFTYESNDNNSNVFTQPKIVTLNHVSKPIIYSRPTTYTFSQQPTNTFMTIDPHAVTFSGRNTYQKSQLQNQYQYGVVNRATSPVRLNSPRKPMVSFNYKSPTNTQIIKPY